jgi:hypothetical protein
MIGRRRLTVGGLKPKGGAMTNEDALELVESAVAEEIERREEDREDEANDLAEAWDLVRAAALRAGE